MMAPFGAFGPAFTHPSFAVPTLQNESFSPSDDVTMLSEASSYVSQNPKATGKDTNTQTQETPPNMPKNSQETPG